MKNLLRLNLLFCFLILASVGWAKAQTGDPLPGLPEPFTQAIIDQTDLAKLVEDQLTIGVFANGTPVYIEPSEDGKIQLRLEPGGVNPSITYTLDADKAKRVAVFGGGYDNEEFIDRTYVTLKKGVTIGAIVGGSYGTEAGKGKVNEANISLGGGTVLKYVVGGGVLYSETTSAGVGAYREESGETVTVNGWLIPCMESGQTQGTAYGEYENSPCKVGNMEWSMSAGTYKYIGVAGGNGNKACTNTASASISSATITGGIFGCGSNGRGASARVYLSSCTIGDGAENNVEIAAVNRGLLGDFSIQFDNCTYYEHNNYHFNAGATYDWSNGGKQLNDEHRVTGTSAWGVNSNDEFLPELGLSDGLEGDLSTRGFSVAAREFIGNSKGEPTKVFEIPSDKEWNFSGIFSLYSGVTIEKKGVLSVGWDWNVSSVEQLRFAQECMENGRTISLQTGTYLLSSPLVIDKELKLEGNGSIWEADPSAAWPADKSDLITVEAESTISIWLNNLTVQKSKGAGICAKTAQKVYLNDVTLKDNETAGLIVLAAVNAERLHTSGNKWGGVYLDKSESTTEDGKFRFYAGCTYEEDLQIWAYAGQDHIESSGAVYTPWGEDEQWYDYNFRNEEDRYIWLWTNTKRNVKVTQETIDGFTYVYANGYYAKVTQSETDASKVVIEVDYSDIVESESDKTILFGGCKDYPASSSYISIEGGKIHTVYGGGWGQTPDKSADVERVHINMNGGEVSHLMIGGGKGYARSGKLEVRIYDGNGVINEFYPGGDAEGITGNTLTTPLEEAYNRVEEVDVRIESGTIRQALGLGGGLGLTHTGKSTIFIEDITLGGIYGASANGHADKIYAQFRNCKFGGGANTIATLNKGMIGNIQIDLYDNQYADGIEAYLGAAPGWGNTYTAGEPAPEVSGGVSYNFNGDVLPVRLGEGLTNANVGIGNAPVVIGKFFRGEQLPEEEQYIDVFEIGADKQWVLDKNSGFDSEHPASLVIKGRLDMFPSWYYNLVATSTSLLVVPERNMTMADFLSDFNWANNGHPMDLSDKSLVFDCTDGAIVSNKALAKQWMATGKNVQLLQYNADAEQRKHYSLAYIDPNETLRITNLPDAVSYGTAPIELAFNQEGVTASITAGGEFAKIENGKLTVLKPGEVKITLTTDEESETVTQDLKITKRILTLTGGLTTSEKVYDGTTAIGLTKGDYAFTGLVGEKTVSFVNDPTGVLVDANAGDNKQVTVTAALADGMDAFYELAPISFVTAKVTPKPIEIKANDVTVNYGETIPFGTNDYQASLIEGDRLEGELKYSCTQTSSAAASVYADAITPYGLSSQNYQITYKSGSLTVEAFGPSIEIMEHKIVKEGVTTKIEMKAKLNHNGGAEIDKVTFSYKQGDIETPVVEVTEKMEVYTASYPNMAAGNYELKVTAHNRAGHSGAASIPVTVDEKTPQNLTWDASVLSTMVYGQEMTLSASSDQTAATGELLYSITTYDLGKAEFADPSRNIIKATKEGEFMITAKRAEDPNYSPALVEKKVVVVQKPITVEVGDISKTYDGTTTITNVPNKFTLSGVEAGDNVAVDVDNLTLKFASKNAGVDIPVILPELKLTGADAGNYVLVQPKNVTGTINQKDLKIKVKDVTRAWNQKYTKYEFETEGLIEGETLADAYQGQLVVTEVGDNLVLSVEDDMCPNYAITPISGSLEITKGTPVAVVYGSGSYWNGLIVDYQGYSEDEIEIQENSIQQTGQAIVVTTGVNPREIARSINSKPTATRSAMRAAFGLRAEISSSTYPHWDNIYGVDEIPYGSAAISFQKDGYSYQSTNTSILNFVDDGTNVTVTPVGVGDAAILATSGSEVKVWMVTVTQKRLTLTASMDKGYDGSTVATGTVSLSGIVSSDVVDLDLSGISFNFVNKNVANDKPILPSQPLVLTGTHANNYTFDIADLKGDITTKAITIGNPLTVYYNGSTEHELTSYPVSGLVAGDVEPIKVTLESAGVGLRSIITDGLTLASETRNYTISTPQPEKATVQRSTLVVTLPNTAFSEADLLSHVSLTILETGETVTVGAVDFRPMITTVGSGASAVYSVTGGDTDNYAVMYSSNQVGQTAAPVTPGGGTGGGGTVDPDPVIPTVSNPVVAERTATTAAVTWEKVSGATSYKLFLYAKKTDSTPLKIYEFDKDGKLKATAISFTLTGLEEGKAYYVETAAYNALGTLLVKKSVELSATPTGIEAISEGSQLYTIRGAVVVAPAEPLQVAIYSVTGQTLFNDEVSYLTQVPAKAGIYVVVIQKGNDRITEKVIVK